MSKLPFKSDGCTGVPDFNVRNCCEEHDFNYHHAIYSRAKSDLIFFKCIVNRGKGKPFLSKLRYIFIGLYYWAGVRIFGKKYYKG